MRPIRSGKPRLAWTSIRFPWGSFAGIPGILVGAAFVEYVQVYAPKWVSDSPGIPTFAFGAALVLAAFASAAFSALTIRWQTGLKRGPAKETS